jgi:coiled-coil domain-containing protein 6
MKRLEQLKQEKQALANEVEQEEEFLTNNLQKRLERVRCCLQLVLLPATEHVPAGQQLNKEKVDLENRLEAEQEYIVNKLRKQVRRPSGTCRPILEDAI